MKPPQRQFVDEMGLLFEASGAPRMMGRLFGFLLLCDPEVQTLPALCRALGSSKGATSVIARQLATAQLIERVHVDGSRAIAYRVRRGAWVDLMRLKMEQVTAMRHLAERGLGALADAEPERRTRLEAFRDFYAYMERELEPLISAYQQEDAR